MQLGRFLRTVRYLRREQVVYQILNRLRKWLDNPASLSKRRPTPTQWHLRDEQVVPNVWIPVPIQSLDSLRQRRFVFLNESRLVDPQCGWEPEESSRLWTYNLHYFDWLWSCNGHGDQGWQVAQELTNDWLDTHPPRRNATGWEPYPTSLRLMNWCLLFAGEWKQRLAHEPLKATLVESMWKQSCWLASHLEYHLLANHLLENAVALTVVGKCFEGTDAARFSRIGNSLAIRELKEQILSDGLHYERSPMYHARICWLVAVLTQYGDATTSELAKSLLPKMLDAMELVTHPDRQVALFNDSATGIYSVPAQQKRALGAWALGDAGYFGWNSKDKDYIIVDCGEVGPTYQPGHAHADTLAFEWSIRGQRFLTNTGTFAYAPGEDRRYDRSTLAHNALAVNGQNSSEVWSSFRVGRRCVPKVELLESSDSEFKLHGSFQSWNGWKHIRCFSFNGASLLIDDQLEGRTSADLECRFHFAPGVTIELHDAGALCQLGSTRVNFGFTGPKVKMQVLDTRYSPEFGTKIHRKSLAIQHTSLGQSSWRSHFTVLD